MCHVLFDSSSWQECLPVRLCVCAGGSPIYYLDQTLQRAGEVTYTRHSSRYTQPGTDVCRAFGFSAPVARRASLVSDDY